MGIRLAALSLLLVACGPRLAGDDTETGADAGRGSLRVSISDPQIFWVDGVPETSMVVATHVAADGTETDVTDRVTFEASPLGIGGVQTDRLVVTGDVAGKGSLAASFDGLAASADFEVFVTQTVTGTAGPNAPGLFATATPAGSPSLSVAYPPAGALIPPNLGEMDVHWRDPASKDLYEVTLTGGYVTLKTYITTLGAASWHTFAAAQWSKLSSGAKGVDLEITVRGLSTAAPATFIEGSQMVRIAEQDVRGGVYYWNTSKQAIMRFDMTASAPVAEQFYPKAGEESSTGCVGCHAVSRDGTVVAYRRHGGVVNYGNAVQVQGLTKKLTDDTQAWNFSAVHPNNQDLFSTSSSGLYRTDLATAAISPLYTTSRMSHPDVSPSGLAIVATRVDAGDEVWMSSGGLVVFDYDPTAKTVGAPRTLVDQTGPTYPYYPSFSPDGQWVLFNRAQAGNSYDNANAELWVTRADGTGTPIRLLAAEVAGTYNSWPKWTPFVTMETTATGSEPVMWFTVASRRDFGVRSAANQKPQLWLAPFYPQRATQPTTPAVRLPFQLLSEGNHIAQWTEQIIVLQ